ncbi:MAG: PIN domain-containing protein [Gemmataceae bacterium]|nr:PIN domain-containing protein [Gemmataceae bacterium]MCI0739971.1 PIN domain-containing protein [Gemmataceae bacterium]
MPKHMGVAISGRAVFAVQFVPVAFGRAKEKSLSGLTLTADDMKALLDYFCHVGKLCAIRFRVRPSVADPDDELVLEAAIASGSEWIVTAAGAARYGIEVITPGEAVRRLGWNNEQFCC